MGKLKKNIGHNLDFSLSLFVNRNSYWGHENDKINLPSVFNCLIRFFFINFKDQATFILPLDARQHTLYTYLEITEKNQLLKVIQKIKIKNRKKFSVVTKSICFFNKRQSWFRAS